MEISTAGRRRSRVDFGQRRRLRQGLGLLWVVDGLLQAQPFMWTKQFGGGTLAAAAVGQPVVVAAPVRLAARVVAGHPVLFNTGFVTVQLALGLGLLLAQNLRWSRLFCIGSLGWALGVWVLGEGLGGVLGGQIGLEIGAPGAALLYAMITASAWPSDRPVASWLLVAWAAVWVGGAVLQLLPAQRTALGLGSNLDMAAMMSPGVLARPESQVASWLGALPAGVATLVAFTLAALQAFVGVAALAGRRWRTIALRLGAVLAVVLWVFCQGFGGLSTGTATDPSTAPLLVLMAFAGLSSARVKAPAIRPLLSAVHPHVPGRTRHASLSSY
jgi:hypothetical protein